MPSPLDGNHPLSVGTSLWRQFQATWKPMFSVHLLFVILGFVAFGPLASWCVRLGVSFSGEVALSDTDIAGFMITPLGLGVFLLLGSLLLTIAILGYAALLVPAYASFHDHHTNWATAMSRVSARLPSVLRLAFRFVLHLVLTILPWLAAIGLVYLLLLGKNDINYYLAEKPWEFRLAVGLAGCIGVVMTLVLIRVATGWFYALPLVLFRNQPPSAARRLSKQHIVGRRLEISASVALWLFGTPLIASVINTPLSALGLWAAPRLADRLPALALLLAVLSLLLALVGFALGFIGISLLALQNIRLYRAAGLDATATPQPIGTGDPRLPFGVKTITAAAVAAVGLASVATWHWIEQLDVPDKAVVIAHRGDSGSAPENTMAAIQQAVEAGSDWVEIDVQETADGVVVVFHDSDFKRVGGNDLVIWEAQSRQLADIDIGSWFEPGFAAERTPTLAEVLAACRNRCGVLIELKYYGHDQQLEQRVIAIVEQAGMTDDVMIMSLKHDGIRKIRSLRPDWRIGLLSTVSLGDITKLDVDFLGLNARAANRHLLKRADKAGIDVFVWTINDSVGMSSMLSRGVDGLITDEPALARSVLRQRTELNPGERLLIELAAVLGKKTEVPEQ